MHANPTRQASTDSVDTLPTISLPPEDMALLQERLQSIDDDASFEELMEELDSELKAEGVES